MRYDTAYVTNMPAEQTRSHNQFHGRSRSAKIILYILVLFIQLDLQLGTWKLICCYSLLGRSWGIISKTLTLARRSALHLTVPITILSISVAYELSRRGEILRSLVWSVLYSESGYCFIREVSVPSIAILVLNFFCIREAIREECLFSVIKSITDTVQNVLNSHAVCEQSRLLARNLLN